MSFSLPARVELDEARGGEFLHRVGDDVRIFDAEHEADVGELFRAVAVAHGVQHQHLSRERPSTPAAAMQRTIQREKAWPARMSPNSTSESPGEAPEARCAEETMSRGVAGSRRVGGAAIGGRPLDPRVPCPVPRAVMAGGLGRG